MENNDFIGKYCDFFKPMVAIHAEKLNNGKISYHEYTNLTYNYAKFVALPDLFRYAAVRDWDNFIKTALIKFEVMPEAFAPDLYALVPDDRKYQFAVEAYTHHGDRVQEVRDAVINARKYGTPTLPARFRSKDVITVYRAGKESLQDSKYKISWSVKKSVAEFFLTYRAAPNAKRLYKAKIKASDIIAYTNDRKEQEIMQYGSVFDIEDITDK